MTLDELIENLMEIRELVGSGNGEVRVATQPGYPLANTIRNVIAADSFASTQFGSDGAAGSEDVWIAADQDPDMPYAPRDVWG